MKNLILFRVDGYSSLGYGHLFRSITLAEEFIKNNFNVVFVTYQDDYAEKLLKSKNFKYFMLNTKAGKGEDLKNVINLIKSINYDNLIFYHDNYDIHHEYEKEIKKYAKLIIAMDDEAKRLFYSDIIINQNYNSENYNYKVLNRNVKILAGIKYAILRDEILKNRKQNISEKVKNILLIFGGSDLQKQSYKFLNIILKNFKSLKVNLIFNRNYPDYKLLKKIKNGNVILYDNPSNIGSIMNKCDVAISAGGSTVWELLYIGIPTLLVIVADNQEYLTNELSKDGYVFNMGWYDKIDEDFIKNSITKVINDVNLRLSYHKKSKILIDGMGKIRVLNVVKKKFK